MAALTFYGVATPLTKGESGTRSMFTLGSISGTRKSWKSYEEAVGSLSIDVGAFGLDACSIRNLAMGVGSTTLLKTLEPLFHVRFL